jgi:hypothetical protein
VSSELTTIKVPKSLRQRISRCAAERHITAAELIGELLDDLERRARFDAVREAYAAEEESYAAETADWDSLADDGLR